MFEDVRPDEYINYYIHTITLHAIWSGEDPKDGCFIAIRYYDDKHLIVYGDHVVSANL